MTNTPVVFGIATRGTPDAPPKCDCATDATGSAAMRKGIMNFIGNLSFYRFFLWLAVFARLSDICPQEPGL
jgi:hypothetical protein